MDDLASSESIDSPQVHIPIHTLYRCCLDTLNSISAIALHDESFKTYYARLKIWGAGLFTEGPSLDRILEEEPEKYRPLVFGLQNTLFSIAIEEVVFLKSRHLLDGNYDIKLQLDPQTKALLDLVSQHDTTILACERRLPHLANTLTIGTPEPLTLQSSSSQDLAPSGSNEEMTREDHSLMKQDARPSFINRIRKKLPAANEVISLSTKKEDAVDRMQTTSPGLGEHGLKEDSDASSHQPSKVCYEDYDIYLGDFVESLFDLLPSIRGIRRTRLLETEFHQSNGRSSSFGLVTQPIWVYEEPMPRPAVLTEQRPLEEKILELALASLYGSRRSTLTVFRKSDVAFRLVSTTKDEQNKDFHSEESMGVNMNSDRFIPAFATSHDGDPINNTVLLCNSHGQELKWHKFQDSSAVTEFQRALMGYRVSHNMSNISWHIGFNKFKKPISGKARLQFWHLKPLPNLLSALDSTTLVGSGSSVGASLQSVDGTTLVGSGSSVGASLQSSTLSTLPLSGSTRAAEITRSRADDIALIRPEPPVLVIFTKCERKYTFFHIRMDSSISAKRQPCVKCKPQNKPCSGILIQSSNRRWSFRKLSAQLENEQGLDSWDLACFRYPEHPAFRNLEQLTKVRWMSLHFEMDEGREFYEEFKLLENLRDVNILEYNRTLKGKKERDLDISHA